LQLSLYHKRQILKQKILIHLVNFFNFFSFPLVIVAVLFFHTSQIFSQSDSIQTNVPSLKNVYAHDFYIGCILSYRNIGFPTDPYVQGQSTVVTPNGGYLVKFHMNSMTPGNNMKPQYTVDISSSAAAYSAATDSVAKDSINTHPIIKFNGDMIAQLNWAKRQGFTFRGHTLVWHNQTPTQFFRTGYTSTGAYLTKEKMTERLDNYIKSIISLIHANWPGLLSAFDIVNEAIDDNTGAVRRTSNEWYTVFGDSTYIMDAFEFARKYTVQYGETQIKLYYNDYNTDVQTKADGIVRLLTPIYKAGFLDGIGMQNHNSINVPTAQNFIASYNKFYPICNEMAVTELDVTTGSANPSASVLAQQANQYGQLFKCFVERSYFSGRGKIINVTKDGLNDAYTFKTNQSSSLWDSNNQCKPAFYAVARVGIYYNKLDSLISFADSLKQSEYTSESWSELAATLDSAKSVMNQNFSFTVSADTALSTAENNLETAVNGLVKIATYVNVVKENNPKTFSLSQNYPNPFNPTTRIKYSVPQDGYISLKVYNLLGQEVTKIFEGFQHAGSYVILFDGSKLASGVYLYQLKANNYLQTRKLILLK
jgi:endo-1,4-beta-xylanase